jgi:hypothetical protein
VQLKVLIYLAISASNYVPDMTTSQPPRCVGVRTLFFDAGGAAEWALAGTAHMMMMCVFHI